jgi:hypothetical protein
MVFGRITSKYRRTAAQLSKFDLNEPYCPHRSAVVAEMAGGILRKSCPVSGSNAAIGSVGPGAG